MTVTTGPVEGILPRGMAGVPAGFLARLNAFLDRAGVPREGRSVTIGPSPDRPGCMAITIVFPRREKET